MSFHTRSRGLPGHLTFVGDLEGNLNGSPVQDRSLNAKLRRDLDQVSWSFQANRSTGDLPSAAHTARGRACRGCAVARRRAGPTALPMHSALVLVGAY